MLLVCLERVNLLFTLNHISFALITVLFAFKNPWY